MTTMNSVQATMDLERRERSARTRNFWSKQPSNSFAPFMPTEMKDAIASSGAIFTIYSVKLVNTVHGETWMVDVDFDGQRYTIPFSDLPHRTDQMEQLKEALISYGSIEATLTGFIATSGSGWNLAPPPDENAQLPLDVDTEPPY